MQSTTPAVIGTAEIVLIVMAVFVVFVLPLAVLVGLWLMKRPRRVPPSIRPSPDDRQTTLIDF